MAEDKKGEDQTEELRMVDEDGKPIDDTGETIEDQSDDESASGDDEEEGREGGDERAGHADESDENRQQIRQRRREERAAKKDQRRRDQLELRFLRNRNDQLERQFSQIESRVGQSESLTIEGRIQTLDSQIREAENLYAQAISTQKGEEAAEAMRVRDQLRDARSMLMRAKEQHEIQGRRQPQQRRGPDPAVVEQASLWRARNDWYDDRVLDEDSAIAKSIENQLAAERRLDPRTPAYWDELDRRIAKRLPHLADEDSEDDDEERPNGKNGKGGKEKPRGPRMTSGGRERPLRKGEVYVSPARIEALKEAGVWDDPKLRAKYLKKYADYDRENAR